MAHLPEVPRLTPLKQRDLDPNPFRQFEIWFEQATEAGIDLPNAMTLATATAEGIPSARMVLLKGFDEHGFVFYTNYASRKGQELAHNPHAALVFYWGTLERQIRITGRVNKISAEESEQYFQSRPRESRLGAWASQQSQVIRDRDALEKRFQEFDRKYQNRAIPLPPCWGGFRVSPGAFEFWQGQAGRLHDRFRYTRQADAPWLIERLSP